MENEQGLKKFSTAQLLNFCLGFFGLQFAWQMRIILSGPVTESLGASPLLFGLIWLAGPVTGMLVQPIIGAMSDATETPFGRRRPYLLAGALFASLALWAFPQSGEIAQFLSGLLHLNLPVWSGLLIAAIMIWVIDACVNAAQGPYRALIPDNVPTEQHSIANSYLSFAIGLGSVIAAGTAPFLNWAFGYQMSVKAQFVMAALAFSLAMIWTCVTTKERKIARSSETIEEKKPTFIDNLKEFFNSSPDVFKICAMQFFTWLGVMSLMIFFTQFAVHNIFGVPDTTSLSESAKSVYEQATIDATNFSSIGFAVFNLVCFLVSIPIGILSSKFGNKMIHIGSLVIMALTFFGLAATTEKTNVMIFMGIAGIGWASILALPFAMLSEHIKKGSEGAVMGIFNIFIAGPQVLVCTVMAWFINKCTIDMGDGLVNHHWEYSFLIGGVLLLIAAISALTINEKQPN
ncbi:MFS transporter [bacterium]|nr:MFS transporter [bacterium]